MAADEAQDLFAAAERAFAAGELDAARTSLSRALALVADHPALLHLLALVEKKTGNAVAARQAFERALAADPTDVDINNNFANLLAAEGEAQAALERYDFVLRRRPDFQAARLNRALALQKVGDHDAALADLDQVLAAQPGHAGAHAARGASLTTLRQLEQAAGAYDRALAIDPRRQVAVLGRAVVAKERGEIGASQRYRAALALAPGDRQVILGLAETLEAEGSRDGIDILADRVAVDPGWWAGHGVLARMRWEAGEGIAFTRSFDRALQADPKARDGWFTLALSLAAAGLSAEAADVAARGLNAGGEDYHLLLLEALHASEAGQIERAERLYARLPAGLPSRAIHESRHRLRTGDIAAAARLVDAAREAAPWDMGVWAMTGIIWRLTGDPRSEWLLPANLLAVQALDLSDDELIDVRDCLRGLHHSRVHPIGQSLRGGTQTRGRLFDRQEPALIKLKQRILDKLDAYWQALPPTDPTHPLLRHRGDDFRLAGSWSVRLTDRGFHVAHMHSQGLLSSACYIVVPETDADRAGWLEIGGAPDGLDLPIKPMLQVEPKPGRMALFPSYAYHGTRPFPNGERLSVAFDVVAG